MNEKKKCSYLQGINCSHKDWLLSNAKPWLSCRAIKELHHGCPLPKGKENLNEKEKGE